MGLSHSSPIKIHTKTKCSKKPTKKQAQAKRKASKNNGLCKRELYSLLLLGIGTPKREEQESGN
jgi:hypothetical protein